MTVSDFALREGVLLDALQRTRDASLHHLRDLRYQSVRHLADICPDEREHVEHATAPGAAALRRVPRSAPARRRVPRIPRGRRGCCATWACSSPTPVTTCTRTTSSATPSTSRVSPTTRSSSSPRLPATTARAHPRRATRSSPRLAARDQEVVRKLAGILRVAIALDRTHAGVVRALSCRHDDGHLTVARSTPMAPMHRSRSTRPTPASLSSRKRSGCASTSRRSVCRMSDDVAWLDATAQAELVRTGQISPVELVEAAITRTEKLNPEINAVIHTRFDKARAEAESALPADGPFRGVPIHDQGPGRAERGRSAAQRDAGPARLRFHRAGRQLPRGALPAGRVRFDRAHEHA